MKACPRLILTNSVMANTNFSSCIVLISSSFSKSVSALSHLILLSTALGTILITCKISLFLIIIVKLFKMRPYQIITTNGNRHGVKYFFRETIKLFEVCGQVVSCLPHGICDDG